MSITNATAIELVWTIANLITLSIMLRLSFEAVRDREAVRRSGRNGALKREVEYSVRAGWAKSSIAGALTAAGVFALFMPSRPGASEFNPIVLFLLLADAALVYLAVEGTARRAYVMEYLEHAESRGASRTPTEPG